MLKTLSEHKRSITTRSWGGEEFSKQELKTSYYVTRFLRCSGTPQTPPDARLGPPACWPRRLNPPPPPSLQEPQWTRHNARRLCLGIWRRSKKEKSVSFTAPKYLWVLSFSYRENEKITKTTWWKFTKKKRGKFLVSSAKHTRLSKQNKQKHTENKERTREE